MKKRLAIILSMVMLLLVGVVGCTSGDNKTDETAQEENKTVVITDQKGEVEVPVNPKNIVVLDYGSLDIMSKLGVEPVALPKGSLPSYLDKYKDDKYVDLGSLKEFDLEKINAAEPDLIIIEGRQESYYEDLKKIAPVLYLGTVNNDIFASAENNAKILGQVFNKEEGVTAELSYYEDLKKIAPVLYLGTVNNDIFASAENNAKILGQVFNKEEGVTAELESINKRLEAVNAKVKENNSTALMTMFNEGSLSVYGIGSRYDMVYSKFGFTPADTEIEVSNHGQNISFE